MEFWDKLIALTGVNPLALGVVCVVVIGAIAALRKATAPYKPSDKKWWPALLISLELVLGVGLSYLAWATGLYACDPLTVLWIGLGTWLITGKLWTGAKRIPGVKEWLEKPLVETKPEEDS